MTDPEAEALLNKYARMVDRLVRRYEGAAFHVGLAAEDLAQEARLALLQAAERHDPAKGAGFLSFAWQRIRWQLSKAIDAARPRGQLPGAPAPLPLSAVPDVADNSHRPGPVELHGVGAEALRAAVRRLPVREAATITARYGLAGASALTGPSLAGRMQISPQAVNAIERRALARLRERLAPTGPIDPIRPIGPPSPGSGAAEIASPGPSGEALSRVNPPRRPVPGTFDAGGLPGGQGDRAL